MHKINHANIKEWAANYDGPLFDGILCDPPYHLVSMTKRWDYVEGVELTEEYIPIAEARIKYWTNISQTSSKSKTSAKKNDPVQKEQQELLHI